MNPMLYETPLMTTSRTFQNKDTAQKIIKNKTLYAASIGLIPFPVVDAVGITSIQLWMIRDLSKVYDIPFKRQLVKSFIGSLMSNVGALGMVKLIPGVGSVLGGTTVAVSAAAATYALGQLFMQHFDQGGTLLSFDPIQSRVYFQKLYEEGKAAVEQLKKEKAEQLSTYKAAIQSINLLKKENEGLKEQKDYYLQIHEMNVQAVKELQEINEQLKADETDKSALQQALAKKEAEQLTAAQSVAALQQSNAALRTQVSQLQKELEEYRKQKAKRRKKRLAMLFIPLVLLLFVAGWWWIQGGKSVGNQTSSANLMTTLPTESLSFSMMESNAENENINTGLVTAEAIDSVAITPALASEKIKLNFSPRSSEAEMADFLSNPNATFPKTFWMRKIYFEGNSTAPHPSGQQQIENIAIVMKQYPNLTIRIYGEVADKNDKAVGIQQANAIKELLFQKGIAKNRMWTSFIIKKSLATNSRRIEIEVLNRE